MTHKVCEFNLKQWSAWGLGELSNITNLTNIQQGKPALENIGAMVKRRMPLMAKYIYDLQSNLEIHQSPTVFASKNAELSRTFKIIRSFDTDVSPAQFSMSVHNAIAGLLSVINKDTSNYTVIDSLSGILETAVIEAVSLLSEHPYVKVVYFEEQSSGELDSLEKPMDPAVIVMLLERGNQYQINSKKNTSDESRESFIDLVKFLSAQVNVYKNNSKRLYWTWHRNAEA